MIEGWLDEVYVPLLTYLDVHRNVGAERIGLDATGEQACTLGTYLVELQARLAAAASSEALAAAHKGPLGTFNIKEAEKQADTQAWLKGNGVLGRYLPNAAEGGLADVQDEPGAHENQFGPFTFGGMGSADALLEKLYADEAR